jgi:hypothetical protein
MPRARYEQKEAIIHGFERHLWLALARNTPYDLSANPNRRL